MPRSKPGVASRERRSNEARKNYPFKRVERSLVRGRHPTTTRDASDRMSRIRQQGTAPELAVRQIAWSMGLRYTTQNRDLPGSPDLANRSKQWAVFVHGCYWHRHEGCYRATTPKTNQKFWLAKFVRNVERDAQAEKSLTERGYRVAVVWECDVLRPAEIRRQLENLDPAVQAKAFRGKLVAPDVNEAAAGVTSVK